MSSSGQQTILEPVTGARVAFEVDKNDAKQFNHAVITVYNLEPTARAFLARPMPLDVDLRFELTEPVVTARLLAGYENDLSQIYAGDILWCHNSKVGPDWITQMELYTGLASATNGFAQVSFAAPTSSRTVLEAIVQPLGMSIRYTDAAASVLEGKTVHDYTTSGLAYAEADEFVKRYGLAFTIEDDKRGLVYDPNSARDPTSARTSANTFSPDLGLIGTPRITKSGIEIKTLLRPNISMFQRFFVLSETTRGTLQSADYAPEYYAVHLKHVGDTRGDEWFTEIEGAYARLRDREIL